MDDNDDDPIVHEIDVVLTKQLLDHLYLFQYPFRPDHMTYDQTVHLGARIKPKQRKVEVEIGVATYGPNYDKRKGAEIASCADGNRAGTVNAMFSGDYMDKQVLCSSPAECDPCRYAVGTQHDGVLYLTPLTAIVQMRPGLQYWDAADMTAENARARAAAEKAANSGELSADEEEAKPLLAKFARHESDEAKSRREASYAHLKRCQDDEAWVKLRHHGVDDRRAVDEKRLLYGTEDGVVRTSSEFCATPQEYLKKVAARSDAVDKTASSANNAMVAATTTAMFANKIAAQASAGAIAGLSLQDIRHMPSSDQIRTILVNVKVVTFARLMTLLSRDASAKDALLIVEQEAVLVQGCWVVKSMRLYPEKSVSGFDLKVPAEDLCRARNYIMWRFTMGHCLTRKDVSEAVANVPVQDQEIMLEQLGVRCGRDGWRFCHELDGEFVSEHPEVVARQSQLWEKMSQNLYATLPINKQTIAATKVYTPPVPDTTQMVVDASSIFETLEQLQSYVLNNNLQKLSASGAVASVRDVGAAELDMEDAALADNSMDEVMPNLTSSFLDRMLPTEDIYEIDVDDMDHYLSNDDQGGEVGSLVQATNNGGGGDDAIYMNGHASTTIDIKREPETFHEPVAVERSELKTALADFAREKLLQRTVVSVAELKDLFSMKLAELPPGHVMGTGVSDFLLERSLIDAGGIKIIKSGNSRQDAVYVNKCRGDSLDVVRACLIELIKVKPLLKITVLRKALGDAVVSDGELKTVLREYCVSGGGSWHVKGSKS